MKKIIPPKHTQYQRFHWFGAAACAASTVAPCACRYAST